jgi:hypothetical protein
MIREATGKPRRKSPTSKSPAGGVQNPKQGPQGPDLATTLKEIAPDEVAIALSQVWDSEALRELINELEKKKKQDSPNISEVKGNGATPPSGAPEPTQEEKTVNPPIDDRHDVTPPSNPPKPLRSRKKAERASGPEGEWENYAIDVAWKTGDERDQDAFVKRNLRAVKATVARVEAAEG